MIGRNSNQQARNRAKLCALRCGLIQYFLYLRHAFQDLMIGWLMLSPRRTLSIPKPLILCVDDESHYLRLRKAVLEQNGFNVITATNVSDAVATFREAPVCCTIADHLLQGETGVELARELKRIKRDVPIILYSGLMPKKLENIDVYINKDESTAGFLRLVREVVERFCS